MEKRGVREGYRLYRSGSRAAQARNPEEIGIGWRRLCPVRARLDEEDDGVTAKWAPAVSCRREGKVALGLRDRKERERFFPFFSFFFFSFKTFSNPFKYV